MADSLERTELDLERQEVRQCFESEREPTLLIELEGAMLSIPSGMLASRQLLESVLLDETIQLDILPALQAGPEIVQMI